MKKMKDNEFLSFMDDLYKQYENETGNKYQSSLTVYHHFGRWLGLKYKNAIAKEHRRKG